LGDKSSWVTPTPPEPLKYQTERAKFEVVGIEREKIPPPSDNLYLGLRDITYQAAILLKINGAFIKFYLHSNPFFMQSPMLENPQGTQKYAKITDNIVLAHNLGNINAWNGILVINVRRSCNAEGAARAWCAERGRHAVIKQAKTCFYCAWKEARHTHIRVIIYRSQV
jgi:hypothetical protein